MNPLLKFRATAFGLFALLLSGCGAGSESSTTGSNDQSDDSIIDTVTGIITDTDSQEVIDTLSDIVADVEAAADVVSQLVGDFPGGSDGSESDADSSNTESTGGGTGTGTTGGDINTGSTDAGADTGATTGGGTDTGTTNGGTDTGTDTDTGATTGGGTDTGTTDGGSDTGTTTGGGTDTTTGGGTDTGITDGGEGDQPAVDEFGVYDIARYVLPAKGGYYRWDGYLEEQGSLTATGLRHEVTLPDRAEGVWINDNVGPISGMTLDYRIGDDLIDVRVKTDLLSTPLEVQLYRYAKVGENLIVPPAPFNTVVTLNRHSDSFDTVVAGQVLRTDDDVLELEGDIDFLNLRTKLSVYISRDLGGVGGADKDCIVEGIFVDSIDDSLPDGSCDRITIDYGVLDPQIIRQ